MTRAVLQALLWMQITRGRRQASKPSSYVAWVVGLVAMVGIQSFTGLGHASSGNRPDTESAAYGLFATIVLSVLLAGVAGPVWRVDRRQAQWIVTAPGGARALVASRMVLGQLARLGETLLLIPLAQIVSGHRPDFEVAAVLAIWYAGVTFTTSGMRYGAATLYSRSSSPWVTRVAAAGVLGGACLLLTDVPAVVSALGRPGTGASAGAFLSAGAWLLVGSLIAMAGVARAEALVARAIAEGDASLKRSKRRRFEMRRETPEPETFTLKGAAAFAWMARARYRRGKLRHLIVYVSPMVAITVGVAWLAEPWTPAITGVSLAATLLLGAGAPERGPVQDDGRLLPVPVRSVALWKIGTLAMTQSRGLGMIWLVTLVLQAGDADIRTAITICFVPLILLAAVLRWTRSPDNETDSERFRRLTPITASVVAVAAAIAFLQPGSLGAALAAAWLLLASLALAAHGIRQIEATLRPARQPSRA